VPGLRVQLTGGLVGDQQRRVVGEGAGDGDPLLLPAGQLTGPLGGVVGEADEGEEQCDELLAFARRGPAQSQRDAHVLGGREDRDEPEGLEDEADAVPAQGQQPALVQVREFVTVDLDRPASAASSPPTMLSSVVFPEPDRPFRATSSPRGTSKETPRRACTAAAP
jgi:hypothetical protein